LVYKKKITILLLLYITSSCFIFPLPPTKSATIELTHLELAYYWAPVWYQDTDASDPTADYITNFNFDGNWIGNDNWDNQPLYQLPAYIYYSVVETSTHYFIGYYDFHPRDWSFPVHENDMEGILLVIQKDDSPQGQFLLMETEAHNILYQFTDLDSFPSNTVSDKGETLDGDVQFRAIDHYNISLPFYPHNHPIVYIEDKGHGVYGDKRWEASGFPDDDGVIYKPYGIAEEPNNGNDRDVGYALLSIEAIWDRRFIFDSSEDGEKTFENFGIFDGDDGGDDSAKAPWGWEDTNDGPTFTGEIFYNPIDLINIHLTLPGDYSFYYTYNPYVVIVRLDEYLVNEKEGFGQFINGHLNLFMIDGGGHYTWPGYDDGVLDGDSGTQANWIGDFELGEWLDMHKQLGRPFYGIKRNNRPYFGIRSKEWKPYIADPWLMDVEETHWYAGSTFAFSGFDPSFTIFLGENHLSWGKSEIKLTLYFDYYSTIEWSISEVTHITPYKMTWLWIFYGIFGSLIIINLLFIISKKIYAN
jgi:hypothetical protein